MNLTTKQETIISDLLSERAELKEKLGDNINHVARIRRAMDKEKNQNAYWKLFDKVKIGERLVAGQTKAFNRLTIMSIADKAEVDCHTVNKYGATLEKRDVRESLGL